MKSMWCVVMAMVSLLSPIASAQSHTVTLNFVPSVTPGTTTNVYRDGNKVASTSMNIYTDGTVINGATYSYFVRAFDGAVESVNSNLVSVTIPTATPPPPQQNCTAQSKNTCTLSSLPASLSFTLASGGSANATINLTDNSPPGSGTIPITLNVDKPWLKVTPATGRTGQAFTVTVSAAGITQSDTGNVIVTATSANPGGYSVNNSPLRIPVALTISTQPPPVGQTVTCQPAPIVSGSFTLACKIQ